MILLPTPDERARALSGLLPNSNDPNSGNGCIPTGKRFMTDLLVSSLMADGGLETALMAAIKGKLFSKVKLFLLTSPTFKFSRQKLGTNLLENCVFLSITNMK